MRSKKFRKNKKTKKTRSRRNKYAGQYTTQVKTQFGTPIKPSEEEELEIKHREWLQTHPPPNPLPDKIYEKQFDIESQDIPAEPIDNDYGYYVDGGKRKRKRNTSKKNKRKRKNKSRKKR